jgi:hypothetical protein
MRMAGIGMALALMAGSPIRHRVPSEKPARPADPAKRAARKAQKKARAITRKTRKGAK